MLPAPSQVPDDEAAHVGCWRLGVGEGAEGVVLGVRQVDLEPVPPSWIPVRYPGLHWTTRSAPPPSTPDRPGAACAAHTYSVVNVRAEFPIGSVTGSATGDEVYVNGLRTTPASAAAVLKALSAPSNTGISIGPHGPDGKSSSVPTRSS